MPVARTIVASLMVVAASRVAHAQSSTQTTTPFAGVTHRHIATRLGNRPQSIHAVTIDLAAPGLSFRLTPANGAAPQMTTEQTTRAFLIEQAAQIAINTHFYTLDLLPTADLVGLAASSGDAYSPWVAGAPGAGINIDQANNATLITPGPGGGTAVTPAVPLWNAFGASMTNGGNPRIVTDGVKTTTTTTFDLTPNPRTAAALLPGNRLLLLTVDGRQPGVAEGLTLPELADFLIEQFDADNAVNLDGGGSTTLAMDHAGPRTMNTPVGLGSGSLAIGTERATGANLAVFATALYGLDPGRELLAYEGFEYAPRAVGGETPRPEAGSVNALNGGLGWASPWSDSGLRWGGVVDMDLPGSVSGQRTSRLNYADARGVSLATVGNQYRSAAGTASNSSRRLDLSLVDPAMLTGGRLGADGTTLWLSFLAQSHDGAGTSGGTQRYAYLQLGESVRFGKLENSPAGNWGVQDPASGVAAFGPIGSRAETMILARIEFAAGADRVSVWINPATLAEAAALGEPTLTLAVADFTFADVSLIGRYSTDFDEIRLGRTMRSVSPLPPPADEHAGG